MKIITRTILILSFVSLFTDIASEMLYPVMPLFLKEIGFSVALIGILEGLAEATAGFSKGYFGKLSDDKGKRLPFIRFGYLLSSISKPMMAAMTYPLWIFFARTTDRLGKGIRTSARDAILSSETTPENKGRVFGFHRAFDTLGATIGPAISLLLLYYLPGRYKLLFLLAFIPGIVSVAFTFFIKEKKNPVKQPVVNKRTSFFSFLAYWKKSPPEYRKIVIGFLAFALFNSSDVFLLLKVKQAGINDTGIIAAYIFYNLVYALSSFPIGLLGDKLGLKKIFVIGLGLFVVVYAGFAFSSSLVLFFILYFIYGLYASATEGISKAWITNISRREDAATAIGTYSAFNSIMALLASMMTGFIWVEFGAVAALLTSAIMVFLVIIYFLQFRMSGIKV